jgi:hypothetical protein
MRGSYIATNDVKNFFHYQVETDPLVEEDLLLWYRYKPGEQEEEQKDRDVKEHDQTSTSTAHTLFLSPTMSSKAPIPTCDAANLTSRRRELGNTSRNTNSSTPSLPNLFNLPKCNLRPREENDESLLLRTKADCTKRKKTQDYELAAVLD